MLQMIRFHREKLDCWCAHSHARFSDADDND